MTRTTGLCYYTSRSMDVCMCNVPPSQSRYLIPSWYSGDASMSPDGTKLIVSNMRSGFDIYDAETGQSLAAFNHIRVRQMRAVPVRFIHDGHAILGGSTVGVVNVWDVATCRKYQPLVVEGRALHCATSWCTELLCRRQRNSRY